MTSHETVHNRALSGAELREIILADFKKLLENEGMLSDTIGFGRVGYDITLRLHLDNPMVPESVSFIGSRKIADNVVAIHPELGAIESAPLTNPSPESAVASTSISRGIDSPNEERLRNDMAVPVIVQQQDGTKTTEMKKYPPQDVGEGRVEIKDTTQQAKAAWGLPDPTSPMPSVAESSARSGTSMCHCGHDHNHHAVSGICTQCNEPTPCVEFRNVAVPLPAADAEKWPVVPS